MWDDLKSVIAYFFIWRILLFLPLVLGYLVLTLKQDYIYFDASSFLIYPWANFDGVHYLSIAKNGYLSEARFFPLFPLIIGIIHKLFYLNTFLVATLFVNLIFAAALIIFYKLIRLDFTYQVAKETIIYLLVFPMSFFFVTIYSEGLFLLLTLLAFYFARRKMWLYASICGMLLTGTRFVGIAILPALIYEFVYVEKLWINVKEKISLDQIKTFLILCLTTLGIIIYSIFNYYQWNDPLYYIHAQGELGNSRSVNSIVLFPQTIFRYFKILTNLPISTYEWWVAVLELFSFFVVLLLLYWGWRKNIRKSYMIFAVVCFGISISTGTFSGLPRYVMVLFPIFIALALTENKLVKILYLTIAPILLFITLMLFSRGYYIS